MSAACASSAWVNSKPSLSSFKVSATSRSTRAFTRSTAGAVRRPAFTDFQARIFKTFSQSLAERYGFDRPERAFQELLPRPFGAPNRVPVVAAIERFTEHEQRELTLRVHAVEQPKRERRRPE